jgi:hypothetical protein
VLLDERGEPLVSDFGLAKFIGADAELTHTGTIVGTPAYMAPEQAAGETNAISAKTDIWSLGVLLYELLTGKRPFTGKGLKEVSQQILTADPPRPRLVRPELDRALEAILLKCLEKNPGQRYLSAEVLAEDLGRWLRHEPTLARPEGWKRRTWRVIRQHPTLGTAVALVLVFLVLLGFTGSGQDPNTSNLPPNNDPIEFLGKSGLVSPPRWPAGEGILVQEEPNVIRLEANGFKIVELLKKVPWARYRFRAQVQSVAPATRTMGIYVTGDEVQTAKGVEIWFYALNFAEKPRIARRPKEKPTLGQATLDLWRYRQPTGTPRSGVNRKYTLGDRHFSPIHNAWRSLSIEVTPDTLCAFWDGETSPFAFHTKVVLTEDRKALASLSPTLAKVSSFNFQGTLGILCDRGSARFRHIVVEPLPDDK